MLFTRKIRQKIIWYYTKKRLEPDYIGLLLLVGLQPSQTGLVSGLKGFWPFLDGQAWAKIGKAFYSYYSSHIQYGRNTETSIVYYSEFRELKPA